MRSLCSFVLLAASALPLTAAENWSQFRGPNGDGHADGKLPTEWAEGRNVKWKTDIHGKGWSSPVVWGDQLWLTTATEDGTKQSAICIDRHTGKIVKDIVVFENENPRFCHPTNSYASCTPVIEDGRVYVHFGSYGTACLDTATGDKLWERRDLECNHWRGPGSSPIIHNDVLIVAYDGYDLQFVVGFDKESGKTIWKQDRNIDYGTDNGDRKKAYSTATVFQHKGRTQVVSPSAYETVAYDPASGDELWRVRHGGMNACARPIYANGLVYIAAGDGPSVVAVRPDGTGDVTDTHLEWEYKKSAPRRPSQLVVGNRIFMINDEGVASCIDAKTADIVWQKRIGGSYRASPIFANGLIYFFSLEGRTAVVEASDKYKLVSDNELAAGFQASPAVAGDTLYLRTTAALYCIDK